MKEVVIVLAVASKGYKFDGKEGTSYSISFRRGRQFPVTLKCSDACHQRFVNVVDKKDVEAEIEYEVTAFGVKVK